MIKEIGPSPQLRKWFKHDLDKFKEFKQAYLEELEKDSEKKRALEQLKEYYHDNNGDITLVFTTKELKYNHVVILKQLLEK